MKTFIKSNASQYLAIAGLACFLAASSASAIAQDASSKQIIGSRADYTSAHVLTLPAGTLYRQDQKESDLRRYGCAYEVNDKAALDALVDLLRNAGIVDEPPFSAGIDARFVIYLRSGTSQPVKLVFTQNVGDNPAHGIYNDSLSVRANEDFAAAMRRWTAQQVSAAPCRP